jgi:peroxiredoxin Q/BCP
VVTLSNLLAEGPLLLVFYPGDFTPVCTRQLCNYQDFASEFDKYGIKIVGISTNQVKSHAAFAEKYKFSFSLLSDPEKTVAKKYGATSFIMFGAVSRAVFIINQKGVILYRYVEPTSLTRRKADELLGIINDLKVNNLL